MCGIADDSVCSMACTVTVFGRPLAGLPKADADAIRGHLVDLDWCPDCRDYRLRVASMWLDIGARRLAYALWPETSA